MDYDKVRRLIDNMRFRARTMNTEGRPVLAAIDEMIDKTLADYDKLASRQSESSTVIEGVAIELLDRLVAEHAFIPADRPVSDENLEIAERELRRRRLYIIAAAMRKREEVAVAKYADRAPGYHCPSCGQRYIDPEAVADFLWHATKADMTQPRSEVEASDGLGTVRYTMRESPVYRGTYEIGENDFPRTSPDEWCDRRICEGFWGSPKKADMVVKALLARAPRGESAFDYENAPDTSMEERCHDAEGRLQAVEAERDEAIEKGKLLCVELGNCMMARDKLQETLQWIIDQGVKFDHRGSHSEEVVRRAREAVLLYGKKSLYDRHKCDGLSGVDVDEPDGMC